MVEIGVKYEKWSKLEPDKRYCLVDTMILLTMCNGFHEITDPMAAVLGTKTMLVIPDVMNEVTRKHEKVNLGGAKTLPGNFASSALWGLEFTGWNIELFRPGAATYDSAKAGYEEKRYVSNDGKPLSFVDWILLRLVAENPNIDLMTEDLTLLRAVPLECGPSTGKRAHRVMEDFFSRRNAMAVFLRKLMNAQSFVEWQDTRDGTEFYIDDSWTVRIYDSVRPMIEITVSPRGKAVPADSRPYLLDSIGDFFVISGKGGYCPCGDPAGKTFRCLCGPVEYGNDLDGGLDKNGMYGFLEKMPDEASARLLSLVESFGGFR